MSDREDTQVPSGEVEGHPVAAGVSEAAEGGVGASEGEDGASEDGRSSPVFGGAYIVAILFGVIAITAVAMLFGRSMLPAADVRDEANGQPVDLTKIEPGASRVIEHRDRLIYVIHRTPTMITAADDWNRRIQKATGGREATTARSLRPEWLILDARDPRLRCGVSLYILDDPTGRTGNNLGGTMDSGKGTEWGGKALAAVTDPRRSGEEIHLEQGLTELPPGTHMFMNLCHGRIFDSEGRLRFPYPGKPARSAGEDSLEGESHDLRVPKYEFRGENILILR